MGNCLAPKVCGGHPLVNSPAVQKSDVDPVIVWSLTTGIEIHRHWSTGRFINGAQTKYFNFRTSRVRWTKYELMTYVVAYITHLKWCRKICHGRSYSMSDYWELILGINTLSETNLLGLCLGNVQCWYSLKYDMKLPSPASHVDVWNLIIKILYHIKSPIRRFDTFRKIYNHETLQQTTKIKWWKLCR